MISISPRQAPKPAALVTACANGLVRSWSCSRTHARDPSVGFVSAGNDPPHDISVRSAAVVGTGWSTMPVQPRSFADHRQCGRPSSRSAPRTCSCRGLPFRPHSRGRAARQPVTPDAGEGRALQTEHQIIDCLVWFQTRHRWLNITRQRSRFMKGCCESQGTTHAVAIWATTTCIQ